MCKNGLNSSDAFDEDEDTIDEFWIRCLNKIRINFS
jgi:hypothetical protein